MIYLLRHADTDRSLDLHFHEYPLSEKGEKQATEIVKKLDQLEIDLVYSSPFKRSLQTIAPFLKEKQLEVRIEKRLSGRLVGDLPKDKTWDFFEKSWQDFNYTNYGAESAQECADRVKELISELTPLSEKKNILLASHSNPIAFFLNSFDPSINYQWFRSMKTPDLFMINPSLKSFSRI